MVNVAVLGYGTIGSGVVEVLQTNTEVIAQRAGEEIAVKYILDLRDFHGVNETQNVKKEQISSMKQSGYLFFLLWEV